MSGFQCETGVVAYRAAESHHEDGDEKKGEVCPTNDMDKCEKQTLYRQSNQK